MTTFTATATHRKPRRKHGEPETIPFTVAVDTREQAPFTFTGMIADKGHPLVVPTRLAALSTGDYGIVGMESLVCVERKSASDLFSTLSSGRERFEAEHVRMTTFKRSAVVIESDWPSMLLNPPCNSRLSPLSVQRTAVSWLVKYGIPWVACPGRRYAELWTLDFLRKFFDYQQSLLEKEI